MKIKTALLVVLLYSSSSVLAQDDLLKSLGEDKPVNEKITGAFKSSRVINGQSMEFIGKNVMDFRILHRFGPVNTGAKNFWGLDEANMRLGFDYGITNGLTLGIGRSNVKKEIDGFIKYRVLWQSTGPGSIPFSLIFVTGAAVVTAPYTDPSRKNYFSSRMSYYNEFIIGRKFNDKFSLQLSPIMVHRNIVPLATVHNNVYALGIGSRYKITRRTAFVVDYHYVMAGLDKDIYSNPLSVGVDIETGGHVFQLHFSNSIGMNEKEFITNTTGKWSKGQVRFGFNLSRVFNMR